MKPLSPETDQIRESVIKEKLAIRDKEIGELRQDTLKKEWDALTKPTNPSVKQLQARVEILEDIHNLTSLEKK